MAIVAKKKRNSINLRGIQKGSCADTTNAFPNNFLLAGLGTRSSMCAQGEDGGARGVVPTA